MKREKLLGKLLIFTLVVVMVSYLVACGSDNKSTTSIASDTTAVEKAVGTSDMSKEDVTITYLQAGTSVDDWESVQNFSVIKEIKRVTGVSIKPIYADMDKFKVMIAGGGELPDLINTVANEFGKQLVEGKHLLPIDYLLNTNGPDLLKNIPRTLAFMKDNYSFDTGKTYFVPAQVGPDYAAFLLDQGPTLRWDYYKEIGYPQMSSPDDFLEVLSEIVKKHPKTDDGKKVFGIGLWSDWGISPIDYAYQWYDGVWPTDNQQIDYSSTENKIVPKLDNPDSVFWKGVSFFYKANKLGIFDTDSLTMKYDDLKTKFASGEWIGATIAWNSYDYNSVNSKDGKGFMTVPMEKGGQAYGSIAHQGWLGNSFAITKYAKRPEKVMDYINYIYSMDGARTMLSGVKGQHWDIVDGKPTLKEETFAIQAKGGDEWKATGIVGTDSLGGLGLSPFTINPADGLSVSLFETRQAYLKKMNLLYSDFATHYGVSYPNEAFQKYLKEGKNAFSQENYNRTAADLMTHGPDDIRRIEAKLDDLAKKYSAKCILAESDDSFNDFKDNAIKAMKAAGSEKVNEWYKNEWDRCVKKAAQYIN